MISSDEISFVVQGAIDHSKYKGSQATSQVLRSIRRFFPSSEIILSTWKGSETSGLDFDILVESDDPGDPTTGDFKKPNINRQIVSSREGVKYATRRFSVKTRSDVAFTHGDLFSHFKLYKTRNTRYSVLKDRVLVSNITSYKPNSTFVIPFFISDFIYAGLTSDVQSLFNIPLLEESDFNWYVSRKYPLKHLFPKYVCRYSPEAYICSKMTEREFDISFNSITDFDPSMIDLSENVIANNFVILNRKQLGLISLKNKLPFPYHNFCYLHSDWLNLYNKLQNRKPKFYLDSELAESLYLTARNYIKLGLRKHE